ncbi:MAG: alpha/beta fold hydrolase [Bacteroidota bacterium]|nr:alpha/beta fold hydrolase [Bacteroidota bacterium]
MTQVLINLAMNRLALCLAIIFGIATQQNAYSQIKTDKKQQYASFDDFTLENGQRIVDCKIGYRTFGKLNSKRSNVVIYPTGGGSTTSMMELFFGMDMDVDTTKFYLILIDALGNGVSSSPSNSISQPKSLFPQFTIRDMVNSQYKMLTEKLNIHHLAAIVGSSMGGLQALQWAVSYPDFMGKVVAIEATPKLSTYDLLWMQTYIGAVKSDTAYHDGNYTVYPTSPLSVHLMQLLFTSPTTLNNTVPVDSFSTWLASLEQPNPFTVDCNNIIWQSKAVMMHDITAKTGGSLENAAKLIKAKMLIIANKQDHIINQTNSIKFAELTKAELVVMDNDFGHLIIGQKAPVEATQKFLSK